MAIIDVIREKVRDGEYEFAIPHFFEEMANDDLLFADIERVIARGHIRGRFIRDPRVSLIRQMTAASRSSVVVPTISYRAHREAAFHNNICGGISHEQ